MEGDVEYGGRWEDQHRPDDHNLCGDCGNLVPVTFTHSFPWKGKKVIFRWCECPHCGADLSSFDGPADGLRYLLRSYEQFMDLPLP